MPCRKPEMTKRERVEAALLLQPTDRTPVYDILINDAVIEHFTGKFPPTGEEGLKLRLQATARALDMTRSAGSAPQKPGEFADADGFVSLQEDRWIGGGLRKRPFSDEKGAARWLRKAISGLKEKMDVRRAAEDFRASWTKIRGYLGDDTVVLHDESLHGQMLVDTELPCGHLRAAPLLVLVGPWDEIDLVVLQNPDGRR